MSPELRFSLDLLGGLKKIRDEFSSDIRAKQKADGTPVTELDQKLNDRIIHALGQSFPKDGIVSEELSHALGDGAERTWFIDPLDGTREFIKGLPEWSVHLGLVENNEVIFGLVGALDLNKIYYAHKGQGAFVTTVGGAAGRPLSCRRVERISDLRVVVSRSRGDARVDEFVTKYACDCLPLGSLGLKFCAIAEGTADIYLNFKGSCSLWDTCAPQVILHEAGGHVSYLDDSEIDYHETKNFNLKRGFVAASQVAWTLAKKAVGP